MLSLRTITETLIRLFQTEVLAHSVLVLPDHPFEVTQVPCLTLQGPVITEHRARRTPVPVITKDREAGTYRKCGHPRFYHLDFELIATTASEPGLLDLQGAVARFYLDHPELTVPGQGGLNLTELTPLGGLKRVNLSNLCQSAGRCRVEDCPVFPSQVETGPLILERVFEFQGHASETRIYPTEESP